MASLKVAVITDIHFGDDSGSKLGSKAPRLMEKFIKAVRQNNPDLVVDLGDRITGRGEESDKNNLKSLSSYFNRLATPVHNLIGNHDIKYLSHLENEQVLERSSQSYSIDVNDLHLVFWNTDLDSSGEQGLTLSDDDLEWLEKDLSKTKNKAIIFSHVPLDSSLPTMNDNTMSVVDIKKRFYYSNADKARKIMEDSGKVLLSIGGHRHTNQHNEINGIHYITQQSLTSTYKKRYRVPSGTFSFLKIDNNEVSFHLQGKVNKKIDWTI